MILGESQNAPILELDEDDAPNRQNQFFEEKKELWRFDPIKQKGIDKCILFFPRAFDLLTEITPDCTLIYEFESASSISPIYLYKEQILIALTPLGGPAATNLVEELAHVGIKTFIAVGSCGCLDIRLDIDTLIVPTFAIRDEGISYHYLPASRDVSTSKKINEQISQILTAKNEKFVFSKVWTTDAIYRETPARIERRKQEGAVAVEMECASLAAVCKYKGLEFSEILYITDVVDQQNWQVRQYNKVKIREKLIKIAFEVLQNVK